MTDNNRMRELVTRLNEANRAYYQEDREIISNLEYDSLYDELVRLEAASGIRLAGSPTSKVGYEVVSTLAKALHEAPMLSLDKTKEPEALAEFLGEYEGLLSWKLDGLTIVLKYNEGELKQALTRGNGIVGEDVTHNAKVFVNLPLAVPYKGKFDLRGEAVIPLADFEAINAALDAEEETKYKNPRNLCSGAVRQLSSETAAKRRVFFYAFGLLQQNRDESGTPDAPPKIKKSSQLEWLKAQGFDIAEFEPVTAGDVADAVSWFKGKIPSAPLATDGLVLTFDDIAYSEALGATSKFPRDSLAFKWADEPAETILTSIEWNTSRTGLINPVAVFEPVDIEGSRVSRASLHNVSILRGLALCPGDRITVYKANMIIPQVAENLSLNDKNDKNDKTEHPSVQIPSKCPVCGGGTEIVGDPEVLYCTNPSCGAQRVRALSHFVSRDAMNIAGLSEQTLEKFVGMGIVGDYTDLFDIERHEAAIVEMEGFGQKSFEKLVAAIEKSKDVPLPNFIHALGIRHVGLANAKLLCTHFRHEQENIPEKIPEACLSSEHMEILSEIKGFGEAIVHSLHAYFSQEKNLRLFRHALTRLRIPPPAPIAEGEQALSGLTFVITGDTAHFPNRKAMQSFIEGKGGKVTGTVTAKTSYLINNDASSESAKNKKATRLGVAILTEDELLQLKVADQLG